MKKYLIAFILLLILTLNVLSSESVSYEIKIFQIEKSIDKEHLTYRDTVDVLVGKSTSGFVGPFSLEIDNIETDSIKNKFNVHIITLNTMANTYSKSFIVEYNLPARIDNIAGKNNTEYLLTISPLQKNTEFDVTCNYDHKVKQDFAVKPTAHTEIYYARSTIGDFYWDTVKELMESNYTLFRAFLNLNLPGKTHIYVPPCQINSVIWDKRFGTSVDPTKSLAFAVYTKEYNTVDPFILNQTLALKTFGYTSPFLSEGLANYFSFAIFDMKKILKEKTTIPLAELLETFAYLKANPSIADRISTTFTRFLIDSYSLDSFLDLYKRTDDINLASTLQEVYNKSISELEQEWLLYVDTVTIPLQSYKSFANSSEMMMNYDHMHTYNLAFLENSISYNDSIHAYSILKRSSFFIGDYYNASGYQQNFIDRTPVQRAVDWMLLGSYALMLGENDKALSHYTKASELDSTNFLVNFNIALYYRIIGNSSKAKEILLLNFSNTNGAPAQSETRVILADILSESKDNSDIEFSNKYYREAVNYYIKASQASGPSPTIYLWLGTSYLGLKDYENAISNLSLARFMESRSFYLGMIDLMLAKAYIKTKDNQLAEKYLSSVISSASSVYHQKEAKELLEQLKK